MQISKLILPKSTPKIQYFLNSRLGFCKSHCSKISQQQNNNDNAEETVKEITTMFGHSWFSQQQLQHIDDDDDVAETIQKITFILKHGSVFPMLNLFSQETLRQKLNPDLVQSVLEQNQSCDPYNLSQFFNWSSSHIGFKSQNIKSFLLLCMHFCNSNDLEEAGAVLDQMMKTRNPEISDVVDAMRGVGLTSVGFTQLIYAYKNKRMLNEAVSLLLFYKNAADCLPDLACLNYLMSYLLKNDKLDLLWKVYERLVEANVTLNVYMYTNVIKGYSRSGKMEVAKRVLLEMEEKNCSPNLVTYNVLIGGLCRFGLVNEALDYKKSMSEKGLIPNQHTYTMIIEGLCKSKRSSEAKSVLRDMKNAGFIPDAVAYCSLINGFMREGEIEEALRLKDEMVDENCDPPSTLRCINSLMNDLLKLNKMVLFWKVYEKMLDDDFTPNDFTYTNLIGGYFRIGKADEAKKMFIEMEKKGCSPSLVTYNVLISGLCKTGLVDEALDYKKSMSEKGLIPNQHTYTMIIEGLCKSKRSSEAKLVLSDMKNAGLVPNDVAYDSLVDGLMRGDIGIVRKQLRSTQSILGISNSYFSKIYQQQRNDAQAVKKITSILNQRNGWYSFGKLPQKLNPDVVQSVLEQNQSCRFKKLSHFFNWSSTRIGGKSQNLKSFLILYKNSLRYNPFDINPYSSGNRVIFQMIKTGKPVSDVVDAIKSVQLSSPALSPLINTYRLLNMFDEAVFIVLNAVDCFPCLKFLNCLMYDLQKNDKMDLFWKVYERLEEANVTLDAVMYTLVTRAYCKSGKMEDAKRIFLEAVERNCSPDLVTYNMLIGGLRRSGLVNKALDYKKIISEKGLNLDQHTYNKIIDVAIYTLVTRAYCKSGKMEDAKRIFLEAVEKNCSPDLGTYDMLIGRSCRSGLVTEALDYMKVISEKASEKGLNPDQHTCNKIIDALFKASRSSDAQSVLNHMNKAGLGPNHVTYNSVIIGFMREGKIEEALSTLDEMIAKGIQANASVYRALVTGCCREGDSKWGLLLFDRMVKSGLESTPTFNTLIDGFSNRIHNHCKSGMIKEAENLLMEMKTKKLTPTIEAYSFLLHSYIKSGERSKFFTVVEDLIELGTPKSEVSDLLLDGFSEEYNLEKSFELLDELVAKELCCISVFDRSLYFFCKKGKFFEALACIDEVKKRGVTLSSDTCEALVVGLKNHGYDDETVGKLVVKFGWAPGSTSVNEVSSM